MKRILDKYGTPQKTNSNKSSPMLNSNKSSPGLNSIIGITPDKDTIRFVPDDIKELLAPPVDEIGNR
eukprot:UN05875